MIAVDLRWPPGPRRSCGARRLAPPERPIPEKPPEEQSERRGAYVYLPAGLVMEVPGQGPLSLREAYGSGGFELVELAVPNLMGVRPERAAVLSRPQVQSLRASFSPLVVDAPMRADVLAGSRRVRVPQGRVTLTSAEAAAYGFSTSSSGPDEVALARRQAAVLTAVLDRGPEAFDGAWASGRSRRRRTPCGTCRFAAIPHRGHTKRRRSQSARTARNLLTDGTCHDLGVVPGYRGADHHPGEGFSEVLVMPEILVRSR